MLTMLITVRPVDSALHQALHGSSHHDFWGEQPLAEAAKPTNSLCDLLQGEELQVRGLAGTQGAAATKACPGPGRSGSMHTADANVGLKSGATPPNVLSDSKSVHAVIT